jgi:hypothetical protein
VELRKGLKKKMAKCLTVKNVRFTCARRSCSWLLAVHAIAHSPYIDVILCSRDWQRKKFACGAWWLDCGVGVRAVLWIDLNRVSINSSLSFWPLNLEAVHCLLWHRNISRRCRICWTCLLAIAVWLNWMVAYFNNYWCVMNIFHLQS